MKLTVVGTSYIVLVTDWKARRSPDFERVSAALSEAGIEYHPIGRGAVIGTQLPLALAA